MDESKKRRLQAAGWRVGGTADFLGLTAEEEALIEIRLNLATRLREIRQQAGWSQATVAERLGSSQSRVAKMEAADLSVSLDLMVRSLLTLGASRDDIGGAIASAAGAGRGADTEERVAAG